MDNLIRLSCRACDSALVGAGVCKTYGRSRVCVQAFDGLWRQVGLKQHTEDDLTYFQLLWKQETVNTQSVSHLKTHLFPIYHSQLQLTN